MTFIFSMTYLFGLSQDDYIINYYLDSTKAWIGSDLVIAADNKLIIMGQECYFFPPYNGTPIEGEPCLGIFFILVDSETKSEIKDKVLIENETLLQSSFEPAGNFIYSKNRREFIIPLYMKEPLSIRCPSGHYNRGVATLEIKNNKLNLIQELSRNTTSCEDPEFRGALILEDSVWGEQFITIDQNRDLFIANPNSPNVLKKYDFTGVELSTFELKEDSIHIPKYWKYTLSYLDSSLLSIGYRKDGQGNLISGFYEVSFDGEFINFHNDENSNIFIWEILAQTEDGFYVSGFQRDKPRLIAKFDKNYNENWRYFFPPQERKTPYLDLKTVLGKELLSIHNKSVYLHDLEGELIAKRDYNDMPMDGEFIKLQMLNDDEFVVMGNSSVLDYSQTSIGEPYSRVFLLYDKVSNLNKVSNTENIVKNEFSIFPNPVKNSLYFNTTLNGIDKLFISSVEGKILRKINFSSHENRIDVSSLQSGIYFINIHNSNGEQIVSKFIKI